MAIRFDGVDDNRKFSAGAFSGVSLRNATYGCLINRNAINEWSALVCVDTSGAAVRADLIEISNTNDLAFWNGQTSSNDLSGSVDSNNTSTTNWYMIFMTWSTGNAVRYHWKEEGGAWNHSSIADTSGAATTFNASDLWVIGTTAGADDFEGDMVCWGAKAGTVAADADIETAFTNGFAGIADWDAYFTGSSAILHGFETASASTDRTGNGGNESSASGTTLTSDPTGFSWGGGGGATEDPFPYTGGGYYG